MSYNTDPMGAALDRYITGNWGEDSVQDDEEDEPIKEFHCIEAGNGGCIWHQSCIGRLDCEYYLGGEMTIEEAKE